LHILLVDDHVMFRQGLKFLLSDLDEGLTFSEAGNCEQALELLENPAIGLILLDLNMPGTQGLGGLNAISARAPGIPLAVLSGEENPSVIRAAIEAGASGYITKSSNSEILLAALQLILAGGVYLPAIALNGMESRQAPVEHSGSSSNSMLSERQTAVLLRAIQGQANKVIAADLKIAEGTVKTHLSAAFKVLGVHNRTEAVFAAAKLGLRPGF
jgi:DNA-binding NarL/FixJ family response regulator